MTIHGFGSLVEVNQAIIVWSFRVGNTPTFEVHRVEGSKNLRFSKIYIFHTFQALYCRARCADSKKVSYVEVEPSKVRKERAKLPLASAKKC